MFWWGLFVGALIALWLVNQYMRNKDNQTKSLKDNDGQKFNVDFINDKIQEYINYLEEEYKKSYKEALKGKSLIKTIDYIAFAETNRREVKHLSMQIEKNLSDEAYPKEAKDRLHLAWYSWLEREYTYNKDSIYYEGENFDNLLESLTSSQIELYAALETFGYNAKQERAKINKKVIQEIKEKKKKSNK